MWTPSEYLAQAANAVRLARKATSPETRDGLLAIAESWRDMAIVAARYHDTPPEEKE